MPRGYGRAGGGGGAGGWEEERKRGLGDVEALLIGGGYHRARIAALDPFDKVAGGLAWGIFCSRESIDVDFVENANIGHKLKIGENIENALVAMQCPHELQAHQVQGLDYPKIAAVLKWLMKRVKIVRRELRASMWRHAELCFQRTIGAWPGEERVPRRVPPPPRKFRRAPDEDISTERAHVASVLLEYGHTYQVRQDMDIEAMAEDEEEGRGKEQLRKMQEEQEAERRAMEDMLQGMAACKDRGKVSTAAVSGLVTQQSEAIQRQTQLHEDRMKELRGADIADDATRAAEGRRREKLERKQQQLSAERERRAAEQASLDTARAEQARAEKDIGKKERRLQRLKEELQKLRDELDSDPEKRRIFDALMRLQKEAEKARKEAAELKERCAAAIQAWKERIAEAQAEAAAAEAEGADPERQAELRAALELIEERCKEAQRVAAKRSREVVKVQRAIDEIPTRAELTQYERRFTELYEQVAWKFQQTRQSYNQYNVASDTRKYLEQELSLLKSVEEQLHTVLAPKEPLEQKHAFAKAVEDIVSKVLVGKGKSQGRLDEERKKEEVLVSQHQELAAVQRRYLQGIKDIHDEFARGEHLQSRLDQLSAAALSAEQQSS